MNIELKTIIRKAYKLLWNPRQLRKRLMISVNDFKDFLIYKKAVLPYRRILTSMPSGIGGGLLIVSGRGMNVLWAQIWTLLSLCGRANNLKPYVLTTRAQKKLNRYFSLLNIELFYLEELLDQTNISLPHDFLSKLDVAMTFSDFRSLTLDNIPIGDIALSTYCRHHGTGLVDTAQKEVRDNVRQWIETVWKAANVAYNIYDQYDIRATYHTEVFMEEYGGFYYAALNAKLKVIRFAGTVRDDAYIVQQRTWQYDRLHHAALTHASWDIIKALPSISIVHDELMENFKHRYGNKWHRSKRNQPNTQILDIALAKAELGIPEDRKVAVVYSHILYDTIFFFGTDLFKDYATWLIETVKEAILNDKLEWFIKVHPSNVWRGEMGVIFNERYEEERLIEENFGDLPSHVHIVPANSTISPMTWMQLADVGITVRGTSGLEMAALGRNVVTAGTGRYEGRGFTNDPQTQEEYRELLQRLPEITEITSAQTELAQRYAHGIFILKPFTISSLKPRLRSGIKSVAASDDLLYVPRPITSKELPSDLSELANFMLNNEREDLLSHEGIVFKSYIAGVK